MDPKNAPHQKFPTSMHYYLKWRRFYLVGNYFVVALGAKTNKTHCIHGYLNLLYCAHRLLWVPPVPPYLARQIAICFIVYAKRYVCDTILQSCSVYRINLCDTVHTLYGSTVQIHKDSMLLCTATLLCSVNQA